MILNTFQLYQQICSYGKNDDDDGDDDDDDMPVQKIEKPVQISAKCKLLIFHDCFTLTLLSGLETGHSLTSS